MTESVDLDHLADEENHAPPRTAPLVKKPRPRRMPLFSTGVAAREVGVTSRTLLTWHRAGLVHAAATTLGGHFRWDVDELRETVHAYRMGPVPRFDERGHLIHIDTTGWPRPQGDELGEIEPSDQMRARVRTPLAHPR